MNLFEDFEGDENDHDSEERWIVSYADFITTLFALFVLLFALSAKDAALREAIESVARMMGARPLIGGLRPGAGRGVIEGGAPRPTTSQKALSAPDSPAPLAKSATASPLSAHLDFEELRRVKDKLEQDLKAFGDSGVSLKLTPEGLVISLAAARFFKSGQAEIEAAQEPVLASVTADIGGLQNRMRIEGFTDPMPIHNSRFTDNWDLSAERAGNVLRYLLGHSRLDPDHFSIAGYGPYRPIAGNDTEDGRALNRRVDIVIRPAGRVEQ